MNIQLCSQGDDFEIAKLPGLPANPYRNIDFAVIAQYPNEVVAIYANGDGIVYDDDNRPIHGATVADLKAQIKGNKAWKYMLGPRSQREPLR